MDNFWKVLKASENFKGDQITFKVDSSEKVKEYQNHLMIKLWKH